MREILPELRTWIRDGEPIALATVVQTWGSAPRPPGARMAMVASGRIAGSVSGGCVEAAVIEAALGALRTGRAVLLDFKVADETAWDVGLACGGAMQVLVKPLDEESSRSLLSAVESSVPLADLMVVQGPERLMGARMLMSEQRKISSDFDSSLEDVTALRAAQALAARRGGRFKIQSGKETLEVFVDVVLPPPVLIVVGAVHMAVALCSLARTLGYRTVVVDPRGIFGSRDRFPQVDRLLQSWPQEAFPEIKLTADSAVCMLTHDPKIDDPALRIALNSPAFYVGALGSRKTRAARRERLLDAGMTHEQIERLRAPIGLDIAAGTPEEIALSIMAEIVAVRNSHAQALPEGTLRLPEGSG